MAAISLATPLASTRIWDRWLGFPETLYLAPLPILTLALFVWLWRLSGRMPLEGDRMNLAPFMQPRRHILRSALPGWPGRSIPMSVPGRITIVEAASATESLAIILVGTLFVLPVITGYSIWAYRIFGGKAVDLRYD
jgi:cytochrome d ubiquinol oxidase subunit II